MSKKTFALFFALVFNQTICFAQTSVVKTNGCGPDGFIGIIVPEKSFLSGCDFSNACDNHDICYSRCLEGGDLYGSDTCKDESEKNKRKMECDKKLADDIIKNNGNIKICSSYGRLYGWAVSNFGISYFHGIGDSGSKKSEVMRYMDAIISDLVNNPGKYSDEEFYSGFDKLMNVDAAKFDAIKSFKSRKDKTFKLIGFKGAVSEEIFSMKEIAK